MRAAEHGLRAPPLRIAVQRLPVSRRGPSGAPRAGSLRCSAAAVAGAVPYERLSAEALSAVTGAVAEASRLSYTEVGSEHLLLSLALQRDSDVASVLSKCGAGPEALRRRLEAAAPGASLSPLERMLRPKPGLPPPMAQEMQRVILRAAAAAAGADTISARALLLASFSEPGCSAHAAMEQLEVPQARVEDELAAAEAARARAQRERASGELVVAGGVKAGKKADGKSMLAACGVDLTAAALAGELDPVLGREEEVDALIRILVRRRKSNPCLIGDPGTGKTALAEALAQRLSDGDVPPKLRGCRLISLQLGLLVADTKYRGDFEEKLRRVLDEVRADPRIILFIDEIHTLVGAGAAGEAGGIDAANLLKPALARGELRCVGATTATEYRLHVEKDAALERRFQPLAVAEPSAEAARAILTGLAGAYEAHHGVSYSAAALDAAVRLSLRYLPDRRLPDKAIDLMDEAGALLQLRMHASGEAQAEVGEADVAAVVSRWTGVPVQSLSRSEADALLGLEASLAARVVGQAAAVRSCARAIRRARSGLAPPGRPVACLLFAGPTGVGKTELVKALACGFYGAEEALVRIDCSEYMEAHSVSRLLGPPPGYIGFEAGGQLTEAVRRRPYSVVLLDEVEKAASDVTNVLLQLMEDGRLTDGKGRTVDFSNTLLVMTSNLGAGGISEAHAAAAPGGPDPQAEAVAAVRRELGARYRPEFLNRLDELVVFSPLARADLEGIALLLLAGVARAAAAPPLRVALSASPALLARLVREGASLAFGARPLRRAVRRLVEEPLSEALLDGWAAAGGQVEVDDAEGAAVTLRRGDGAKRVVGVEAVGGGIEAGEAGATEQWEDVVGAALSPAVRAMRA